MPKGRKTGMWLLMAAITVAVMLCLGEFLTRLFGPSEYLYPRYDFSSEYGTIPIANAVMVHGFPRKFEYHYTVNSQRSRGEVIQPGASGLPAVVVLGDSYSFGMGVSDGEEYPTIMRKQLAGRADVVNLGVAGWGLTQEIRRYYELGVPYQPRIVILQFCPNDPDDDLANRVTLVENGEFKFVNSQNSLNVWKKYLARSIVQRSQLYNFFRFRASRFFRERLVRHEESQLETARPDSTNAVPATEAVYVELLDAFAAHLHSEGRPLWFIAVDHTIERFPHIAAAIKDLEARGELRYIEVLDWLNGMPRYASPEGHVWGTPAHKVIGEHLAVEVGQALADSSAAPRS